MRLDVVLVAAMLVAIIFCIFAFAYTELAWLEAISSISIVSVLLTALITVVRDHAGFQRQLWLEKSRAAFQLGAASHMANRIFDKHAEFCEEYLAKFDYSLEVLVLSGPEREYGSEVDCLYEIRKRFSAWVPVSVDIKLTQAESQLKTIASKASILRKNSSNKDELVDLAESLFEDLNEIFFSNSVDRCGGNDPIVGARESVRELLGVDDIQKIRKQVLRKIVAAN